MARRGLKLPALEQVASDAAEKARQEAEWKRCSEDVVYFCNTYIKTYDPRILDEPFIPFILFPKQVEFLQWVDQKRLGQKSGLCEKSRDSGITWLCCVYAIWAWLFKGPVSIGFGSRKLELVDRLGDPDTIFEKMRLILRGLPPWLLPRGYSEDKHAGANRIVNPETKATITGEGGDNIGRGGRKTFYFVDEAAFIERAHKVDAALSANTRTRIKVSTPNGSGNPFYKERFGGKVDVFTFRWQDDPRKTQEWYDEQVATLDPITVAQEFDIDYTASMEGILIPAKWVMAAVDLHKKIKLPTSGPRIGGYDVADEGKNKSVVIVRQGAHAYGVESWSNMNTTQGAHRAADACEKFKVDQLNYDVVGVGAGVKGTYNSMDRKLSFHLIPLNTGETPSKTVWPDGQTSQQKFLNLRAEAWWMVRRRFEKTFEHLHGEAQHPLDELISIPNQPELIAQLSQPLWFRNDAGKIKVESKEGMAKRGVASPDFADALVMAFAPKMHPDLFWA